MGTKSNIKQTILLDMDGILSDYFRSSIKVNFRNKKYDLDLYIDNLYKEWNTIYKNQWDMAKALDIDDDEWWKKTNFPSFWEHMPKTKECDEVINLVKKYVDKDNLFICSSHGNCPISAHGKCIWLKKYFPDFYKNQVLTQHKELLANPNHILIDDNESNIKKFKNKGGKTILFPRPWNSKWNKIEKKNPNYDPTVEKNLLLMYLDLELQKVFRNE